MNQDPQSRGFTKFELLAVIAVLAVVVGLFLPFRTGIHRKSPRIQCVNNLKNVGLAFRIFATDNEGRFPPAVLATNGLDLTRVDVLSVYLSLSNELSTPKILHCPEDKQRPLADSFADLTTENLSYFVSLTAAETLPQIFLAGDRNLRTNGVNVPSGLLALTTNEALSWSRDIHQSQGNIAMGDGSVQQFSSLRLAQAVRDQQVGTNYLVIP